MGKKATDDIYKNLKLAKFRWQKDKCSTPQTNLELRNAVPTFDSVDEILKCDHSNESYWAVPSCGAVYYTVQWGSNFWVCGWNPKVWPFKWKLFSNTFLWYCLLHSTRWCLLLSLDKILRCGHSNNSSSPKLSFDGCPWVGQKKKQRAIFCGFVASMPDTKRRACKSKSIKNISSTYLYK